VFILRPFGRGSGRARDGQSARLGADVGFQRTRFDGTTIHVLDGQQDRQSVHEELVADLLAIVASFSGKLYGLPSHGRARALVEAVRGHVQGEA